MDIPREMAEEQYIQDHEGMCGTCHYWQEGSCMNFESIFAVEIMDEEDSCNRYVPKRKRG